jgi:uncharacterized damage-inducible protein DinB
MDQVLVQKYETGVAKLQQAIAGMSEADLKAAPIPGKWSTQQVIIHLADADVVFAERIRRIVAEDNPTLTVWDENKFAERLFYHDQSVADAMGILDLTHKQTSRILRKMSEADWQRKGVHSHRGPQTVGDVLTYAVNHIEHHLKFIAEKRAKLGK